MARAMVIGSACVVFSELTPEEIHRFELYKPEALKMTDMNNPEDMFTLSMDDGPGHLEDTEAVYSRTKSADGKATMTILLDPAAENKLEFVQQLIGHRLARLQRLEEKLVECKDELTEMEEKVNSLFTQV